MTKFQELNNLTLQIEKVIYQIAFAKNKGLDFNSLQQAKDNLSSQFNEKLKFLLSQAISEERERIAKEIEDLKNTYKLGEDVTDRAINHTLNKVVSIINKQE